jgi:hypothetical protein
MIYYIYTIHTSIYNNKYYFYLRAFFGKKGACFLIKVEIEKPEMKTKIQKRCPAPSPEKK